MCGISGLVVADSSSGARTIDEQLRLLHHRGPDAAGFFPGTGAVVAQNRLAIIDLVTGDPPISNEDSSIGAALNGEIYNFRSLRDELRDAGHEFRTEGDTEVIAHLAEDHDPRSLAERLEGMFAFAVWDVRRRRLILGRDRVGKKPLYYWASADAFVFASEIKAVLAHPAVPRELDPRAIPAYLTFGYVPTPRTFFAGVQSLPPGHVLTLEAGGSPRLERYWEPQVPGASPASRLEVGMDEAARHVRTALQTAVERRLVSDVPLGAFLSGGLDSSAIVAIMAGVLDRPVETFTIGFDDRDGFDERPYARLVAERYRTDHHEFVVEPDAVELIERLVWHHDQPFGDSSAIPTFLLNELTRRHVTVAVSGDGGDELFAGYERFAAALSLRHWAALPRPLRRAGRRAAMALPRHALRGRVGSLQRLIRPDDVGLPAAYRDWLSFFDEPARRAALPEPDDWALADFQRAWDASAGAAPLDRLLDLNLRTYLVDDLLVKADRMSMAHGLEVRSPFLDRDLVELALRLPPKVKARSYSLKRVLKAAVEDLLPAEVIGRRKKGFGVPLDRWFREDLKAYVDAMLGSQQARVKRHLRPSAIDRLIAEHDSGRRDHGQRLWALLTLEVFLRREDW
jgi:asparagine synthase (glutamine-hydrolysing)